MPENRFESPWGIDPVFLRAEGAKNAPTSRLDERLLHERGSEPSLHPRSGTVDRVRSCKIMLVPGPPGNTAQECRSWDTCRFGRVFHMMKGQELPVSDEPHAGERLLTVNTAATFMRVSDNTPYNWIKNGWVEGEQRDGTTVIALSKLRRAKVLRHVDVRNHLATQGIQDKGNQPDLVARTIADAVAAGAATPLLRSAVQSAASPPDSRFSLEDVEAIVAFYGGNWKPTDPPPPSAAAEGPSREPKRAGAGNAVPLDPAEFVLRGRGAVLEDYIVNHREPMDLPKTFWDTRDCPEFVPAAGVFRYTYWRVGYIEEETEESVGEVPVLVTWIRRSKGWLAKGGRPVPAPENEEFDFDRTIPVPWPPGKEVPSYELENQRWRQQRMQWEHAWSVRMRELRAMGIDLMTLPTCASIEPRNRQALLRKYHEEGWGPSDLPDWFWDTEECPPFEPPNGVGRYEYGEPGPNPESDSSEEGTFIRYFGSWYWTVAPCELYEEQADDRFLWGPGRYPAGTLPTQFTSANREWDAAQQAWREEWRVRGRRRRGE